jgi:tRNA threonylcarbamoyladenosine biosynthesis protein TsaE
MWTTRSPEETESVGRDIAGLLAPPALVLLIGDLGAGKTTLVKGVAAGLGVADPADIVSPTFSLVHEYEGEPKLYHLDLYRLDRAPELDTLGLDDLWRERAIVLVEWGDKFAEQLPADRIEIRLRETGEDEREIDLIAPDAAQLAHPA